MSAEETARRTLDAFNNHDVAAMVTSYADNATVYDPQYPEPLRGSSAIREDLEGFIRAFPDIRCEVDSLIASGDTAAFDGIMRGTHQGPLAGPEGEIAPTGKQVEIPLALFMKAGDGERIVEERRFYDVMTMLSQLGVTPAEAGAPSA